MNFGILDENKLKEFAKCLDKFNEKKNETRSVKIITYFVYVLLNINFWTKGELKKQMNLFFPDFSKF